MKLKRLLMLLLVFVINISVVSAGVSKPKEDIYINLDNNSDLKYLFVYNCEVKPEVDYDIKEYMIICPSNTKNLKITYRARSPYSSVQVNGNENIHNGSKVSVIVKSKDNKEKEYIFTVRYSNSKLIYTILIIVIIIILLVSITALVLYILYTKGIIKIPVKRSVNVDSESYVK